MNGLIIRKVVKEDNALLAKLIRNVFHEFNAPQKGTVYSDPTTDDLYALFQKPGAVLWVAQVNDEILGCCGVYPTEGLERDCAELAKFYLSDKIRGKGIGKQLMLQCFQSAREMQYKKLYLESMPQFSKAVSMYEKYGFMQLNAPLGNSGHTTCDIWMIKEL
ncbi:MAG TPA: GNAT family N-acetyltransferase [Parafilimonas sp.]|nr:GNAT family N-acetyltransferase [Parafilimonas sp.]